MTFFENRVFVDLVMMLSYQRRMGLNPITSILKRRPCDSTGVCTEKVI